MGSSTHDGQYSPAISPATITLTILIAFSSLFITRSSGADCDIAVYWGQNGFEGSLRDACDGTYPYTIVNIAFVITFGGGKPLGINLAGHCGDWKPCTFLSDEIKYCQSRGIKVLLSLGGGAGNYGLTSADDAREVAGSLWDAFLGGSGVSRPFGDAVLDGIDFDIEGGSNLYYDELARALSGYSTSFRKVYLSAAPQCFFPDYYLDTAIKTGLFDYVFVQFYNNPPCDCYDGKDVSRLLNSWQTQWTPLLTPFKSKLLLGLPATPAAAPAGGYAAPDVVNNQILPVIRDDAKYGGVMLWSRYFDSLSNFSIAIAPAACGGGNQLGLGQPDLLISQVV